MWGQVTATVALTVSLKTTFRGGKDIWKNSDQLSIQQKYITYLFKNKVQML